MGLFNVLEERDIQVRGYSLRLPLDLLVVATANPEDYTNRGRIITPLKDRFGAELHTHYLTELPDEVALLRQEAELVAQVDDHLLEVLARFTRGLRESASIDQRSGVSARFTIAAAEGVAASALRRAARTGEAEAVARVCDLPVVVPTLIGKIEFEMGEEGREARRARPLAQGRDRRHVPGPADRARPLRIHRGVRRGRHRGDRRARRRPGPAAASWAPYRGSPRCSTGSATRTRPARGAVAAAAEFALEGLFLTRRIEKESVDGRTVYGAA